MTEGFAMLFGWLGWFALLAALSWAVMRRTTKRAPTGFNEMSERPGASRERSLSGVLSHDARGRIRTM